MIIARLISFISNPIFILIGLPYLLVYKSTEDHQTAIIWTAYTMVFLAVFAIFVLVGVRKKFFSDIDVSIQTQRPKLYFTGALLALLYLFGLFILHGPPILFVTIIGILMGIFLGSLINIKVKASVHAAAATALITGICIVDPGYSLWLLLFIPVIGWARVRIKRHTVHEVIVGVIFGCLLSLVMYFGGSYFIEF